MAAHASCRAVGRAVSGVGRWGLDEVSVLIRSTCILRDSGQDSALASPFLERYCPQTIPSHSLMYGREHCHVDRDNPHHRTGLLP
jgi:hypothetical protein